MEMDWLKRIRLSLAPLSKDSEQGTPYQMAKLARITESSYRLIEKNGIGPRERLIIAAWRSSGKSAERLLEEIEQEVIATDESKALETLNKIKKSKKR